MKITKVLPYMIVALLVFFGFMNDTISSAIINFLIAGVIPGTRIQLPWYLVLVLVPLLLFGAWQLIRSIDFVPKDWVAPEKTTTKKPSSSRKRRTSRKNLTVQTAKKKKQTKNKSSRGRAQKKLSAMTRAEA